MRKVQLLKFVRGILFFLIPLYSARFNQELSAKDILKKADDNMRGRTSQTEHSIKISRPTWSRKVHMKARTKGDDCSMILVTTPAKEKETVFLKRIKEVWYWINTTELHIKLPLPMISERWMGADFTNDDFVNKASSVIDYTHKLLGKESITGKSRYKIEMLPGPSVHWFGKKSLDG